MHQTCTGTKKTKKLKFPGTMGPLLSSCWNFCFLFFLFFWCLSMFGASSGLFFCLFLFLVPVNVFEVRVTKPAQAQKKTKKKQTTRCTKPAQAPKKQKKLKFPRTMGPLLSSCWIFFLCLSMFGASSCLFLFFLFCWCLSMFLYISCQDHDEKKCVLLGFRPSKCIKHGYLQCFFIMFNENSLPHGVPPSRNNME